jgi:hypothetical protein
MRLIQQEVEQRMLQTNAVSEVVDRRETHIKLKGSRVLPEQLGDRFQELQEYRSLAADILVRSEQGMDKQGDTDLHPVRFSFAGRQQSRARRGQTVATGEGVTVLDPLALQQGWKRKFNNQQLDAKQRNSVLRNPVSVRQLESNSSIARLQICGVRSKPCSQ